jgi:RNA methyltransferase, TrmH family
LSSARALQSHKGRLEHARFAFEGATLLAEADACGFPIAELYATQAAYDSTALARDIDARGTPVFIVPASGAASISDLKTPSGLIAVAPMRLLPVAELFGRGSPILVLADVNDPANAGTLLRSADAFGCAGVIFGEHGVDPYHPKVVRGSMGAVFRLALSVSGPAQVLQAANAAGVTLVGLSADGEPLAREPRDTPVAIVVGHERRGLGGWERLCERVLAIPMAGPAESLSAAVAGSIALYEFSRK